MFDVQYRSYFFSQDELRDVVYRLTFLKKIIDCVSFALDVQVEAVPRKIIAGLEPGTSIYSFLMKHTSKPHKFIKQNKQIFANAGNTCTEI